MLLFSTYSLVYQSRLGRISHFFPDITFKKIFDFVGKRAKITLSKKDEQKKDCN